MTRSRFSGAALRRAQDVPPLSVTSRRHARGCNKCTHPGGLGSGAVSVLAFWPGTRRTMMDVFFWMSSLSSFHSVTVPHARAPAQASADTRRKCADTRTT